MSHANAALTPRQRLRLARQIVDDGWSVAAAARYFHVSYPTAAKWARRYVELGPAGMVDRSSRPHSHPNQTPRPVVKKIVHLRIRKRLGPVQISGRLGMSASTVHAVLVRCKLNRLSHVDVKTGEPARRYEHETPATDLNRRKGKNRDPLIGYAFVHTVIDDHPRVAYAEIHDDERADTAIGVLHRAVSWFADHGITVERVLSDNGAAYRSHAWRHTCTSSG